MTFLKQKYLGPDFGNKLHICLSINGILTVQDKSKL